MKKLILVLVIVFGFASIGLASDVALAWDASGDATGYKIYQSIDNGSTWDAGTDVGNVTDYTVIGVPDTGLVLFRVGAYNTNGETIRSWSGAWFNGDWQPPEDTGGLGVQ